MIGKNAEKYEGISIVTGRMRYVDDIYIPGTLTLKGLHSPHPHARIKAIRSEKARALKGVELVLTWQDVPQNRWGYCNESYVLAEDTVQYVGQPILVVAAQNEETALEALDLIEVDYEELPAVFNPYEAMQDGPVKATDKPSNWFKFFGTDDVRKIRLGNAERAFEEASQVFEDEFISSYQAHVSLETHVALSTFDEAGRLLVYSVAQGIDWVHTTLAKTLGMPAEAIRVLGGVVGGGFGGKSDAGPEILTALATLKTGKPCKWRWTMHEELRMPVKRGGFNLICKTGVSEDGRILARHIKTNQDCGGYCYRGNKAIDRHGAAARGPYNIPNYWYEGRVVHTNKVPAAALRGFAVPPGTLAGEVSLDRVASRLGLDPLEFRIQNALQDGDTAANGQVLRGTGIRACLEALRPAWAQPFEPQPAPHLRRGRGVGTAIMPIGLTGGEDSITADVRLMLNGIVSVTMGLTEMGQGLKTIMRQLVGEVLCVPMEKITIASADTSVVPAAASPGASEATYMNGNALLPALKALRGLLIQQAALYFGTPEGSIRLDDGHASAEGSGRSISYEALALEAAHNNVVLMGHGAFKPRYEKLNEDGLGLPYDEYTYAACMCQVLIDTETGQMKVERIVSAVDTGRAYNPKMVEGQIEGGAVMNMGYATMENLYPGYPEKHYQTTNLNDYSIPTTMDTPDVESIIVEVPSHTGPLGAKGPSEVASAMIAPAIANAVGSAIGVYPTKTPITSEYIYELLYGDEGAEEGESP